MANPNPEELPKAPPEMKEFPARRFFVKGVDYGTGKEQFKSFLKDELGFKYTGTVSAPEWTRGINKVFTDVAGDVDKHIWVKGPRAGEIVTKIKEIFPNIEEVTEVGHNEEAARDEIITFIKETAPNIPQLKAKSAPQGLIDHVTGDFREAMKAEIADMRKKYQIPDTRAVQVKVNDGDYRIVEFVKFYDKEKGVSPEPVKAAPAPMPTPVVPKKEEKKVVPPPAELPPAPAPIEKMVEETVPEIEEEPGKVGPVLSSKVYDETTIPLEVIAEAEGVPFKVYLSAALDDKDRQARIQAFEDALVKKYPKRGKNIRILISNRIRGVKSKLTPEVKKYITKLKGCKAVDILEALAENTDSEEIEKYAKTIALKINLDEKCETKKEAVEKEKERRAAKKAALTSAQIDAMARDILAGKLDPKTLDPETRKQIDAALAAMEEEVAEVKKEEKPKESVKGGKPKKISLKYEDIVIKEGTLKGQPGFFKTKTELGKIGVTLSGSGDPIWVAIKKENNLPMEMIKERMGAAEAPAEEKKSEEKKEEPPEEVKVEKRPPVPTKAEVETAEIRATKDFVRGLSEQDLEILSLSMEDFPKWKRDVVNHEMMARGMKEIPESQVSKMSEAVLSGEMSAKEVPEYMQSAVKTFVKEKIDEQKEKAEKVIAKKTAAVPVELEKEVPNALGYAEILDENGNPNYFMFKSALDRLGFDTTDEQRNKEWFYLSRVKKKLPKRGEEIFKETWNEFQSRVSDAYGELLDEFEKRITESKEFKEYAETLPREVNTRQKMIGYLWENYGRKRQPIPVDIFKAKPAMSHEEWMRLYLSKPYSLGFDKVNKLWHKYGIMGKFIPESELPIPMEIQKWTSAKVSPEDVQAVMSWIDKYLEPIRYENIRDIFNSPDKTKEENDVKAKEVFEQMKPMTREGLTDTYWSFFRKLLGSKEGRAKLEFLALSTGSGYENYAPLDFMLNTAFGETAARFYDPIKHRELVQDAFNEIVSELFPKLEERMVFNDIRSKGANIRNVELDRRMDDIVLALPDIEAVTDKQLETYEKYRISVGGRDVTAAEIFSAHPELSRIAAKAITEKALLDKSAMEYGEKGRRPIGATKMTGILNALVSDIESYKFGSKKNKLAKQVYDFQVFDREYFRRHGKHYADTLKIDELGVLTISDVDTFARGSFSPNMIPEAHVGKVHAFIRENLKIPTREELLKIIPDSAEADMILSKLVYAEYDPTFGGIVLGGVRPYEFSDDEIEKISLRKGLTGEDVRAAIKAFKEHRVLPMSAIELLAAKQRKAYEQYQEKFKTMAPSPEVQSKMFEIFRASPDRASALRSIGEYIETLKANIKAKEADISRLNTSKAEIEVKQRKSEEDKALLKGFDDQIGKVQKKIDQALMDISLADDERKYRLYQKKKEDYTYGVARFASPEEVGEVEEDRKERKQDIAEYKNFNKFRVEVIRDPDKGFAGGSNVVAVDLKDIQDFWIKPIEQGLDERIRSKAKAERSSYFKELYDEYIADHNLYMEKVDEISKMRGALEDPKKVAKLTPEMLDLQLSEVEKLKDDINNIEREQRARRDLLANYKDIEEVEPSIKDIVDERKSKGKWPENWHRKIAAIAFMNKARELGLYDIMYQMAKIGSDISPPLKQIPLTIYPSDTATVRESLFLEWLENAITANDIYSWKAQTLVDFVGDDWEKCDFGRRDRSEWDTYEKRRQGAGGEKNIERWRDCAIRKAKVIQSQAITQADPIVLQPIIEKVVKDIPIKAEVVSNKEMKELAKKLEEYVGISSDMANRLSAVGEDKKKCETELAKIKEQLEKKGIPTITVTERGRPRTTISARPKPGTEEEILAQKMEELEAIRLKLLEAAEGAVGDACKGDEECRRKVSKAVAEAEEEVKKKVGVRKPPVPREFCFMPEEWDTILLALSERKARNTAMFKENRRALESALEQGIARQIPLYEQLDVSLLAEKQSLENLEDLIKKYEREDFTCSSEEVSKVRKFTREELREMLGEAK